MCHQRKPSSYIRSSTRGRALQRAALGHDVGLGEELEVADHGQDADEQERRRQRGQRDVAELLPARRRRRAARPRTAPRGCLQAGDEDEHVVAEVLPHREQDDRRHRPVRIAEPVDRRDAERAEALVHAGRSAGGRGSARRSPPRPAWSPPARRRAVRKSGLKRASRDCSSSAAASETPTDSGPPTTTKYERVARAPSRTAASLQHAARSCPGRRSAVAQVGRSRRCRSR